MKPTWMGVVVGGLACSSAKGRDTGWSFECGHNTTNAAAPCECVEGYVPCRQDITDCCAYDTTVFEIELERIEVFPLNVDNEPWDWDGEVPAELDDLAWDRRGLPGDADVLAEVEARAPYLPEGSVPPDPYLEFYAAFPPVEWVDLDDDAYRHDVYATYTADLAADGFLFEALDEDAEEDDHLGFGGVDLDTAQWLAGRGSFNHADGFLTAVMMRIEPAE